MTRSRISGGARAGALARSSGFSSSPPSPRSRRRAGAPVEGLERRTLLAAFVVTDAGDSGPGTLRQAILDANNSTGADTITFNLPGPDAVRTIRPLSALPEITGQTTIDGGTQAGVIVELDGSLAGLGANGLLVAGSNSLIRRLVVNRFSGHGVVLGYLPSPPRTPIPTGLRLESSLIGTDAFGNADAGNGGAGVVVTAPNTIVGLATNQGTPPAGRNVISGNGGPGVWVTTSGTSPTFPGPGIFGNYIG